MKKTTRITLIVVAIMATVIGMAYLTSSAAIKGNKVIVSYGGEDFSIDKDAPGFSNRQEKKINTILTNAYVPLKLPVLRDLVDFRTSLEVPSKSSSLNGAGAITSFGKIYYATVQFAGESNNHRIFVYKKIDDESPLSLVTHFIHQFVNVPIFKFSTEENKLIMKEQETGFKKIILMKS